MLVLHLPAGLASWLHKTPSLPSPMSPISLFPRPFFSCAFFWLPTYAATPDTCSHKLSRCHVWYFILSLYLTRFLAWSQPIYPSINVSGIQGLQRVFGELAFWWGIFPWAAWTRQLLIKSNALGLNLDSFRNRPEVAKKSFGPATCISVHFEKPRRKDVSMAPIQCLFLLADTSFSRDFGRKVCP